jgi:hypothetical protein
MAANPPRLPGAPAPTRTARQLPDAPPSAIGAFGTALGTVAIAVGIGVLGAYMLDLHAHTCDACGHRWRHLGAFNIGDPQSHACGKCGVVQWWKDGVPHVFRSSLQGSFRGPPQKTLISPMQEIRGVRSLALPSGASVPPDRPRALVASSEHGTTHPAHGASATKENQR